MSNEQQTASFEEVLLNRLAQRLGVATAQIEALQLQLEMAKSENEQLRALLPPEDVDTRLNGAPLIKDEVWEQSAPI